MNSVSELESRARSGDLSAQLALARHFESVSQTAAARHWFARAASSGSAEAARSLGINLLTQEPVMGEKGVLAIGDAARRGDAEATYLCAKLAMQDIHLPHRFDIALDHLCQAAERGHALAQTELKLLAGAQLDVDQTSHSLLARIDRQAPALAFPAHEISSQPRIYSVQGCAGRDTCDWLIAQNRTRLDRAPVYDPLSGKGRVEKARSNSAATFDLSQSSVVLMLLRERIAATASLPLSALEPIQLLHYAVGESFEPHFDFLDDDVAGYRADLASRGQRVATFLVYLNDDYEGGETAFPKLHIKHHARKGDGLLFWNVDRFGSPDPLTFHAGLPPTRGEKWALSQWLRSPARETTVS
jgi:prolyl 4-hydroxylase